MELNRSGEGMNTLEDTCLSLATPKSAIDRM